MLLAVDGNSLVHRSFHAQAATGSRSRDGRGIWAVRGLVAQLVAAVERIGPDAIVIGFDDPESSIRRDTWPQYKARRVEKLDELVQQLALAVEILRDMGIAVVMPAGLEADDVLASAAEYARSVGATTVIMTSDRDAFSLIDDSTRVLRIINGGVEASPLLTPERLQLMIGMTPAAVPRLRGDARRCIRQPARASTASDPRPRPSCWPPSARPAPRSTTSPPGAPRCSRRSAPAPPAGSPIRPRGSPGSSTARS